MANCSDAAKRVRVTVTCPAPRIDRAYAMALFYLAEAQYEPFLAQGASLPRNLRFDPGDKSADRASTRKLTKWLKGRDTALKALTEDSAGGYRPILELGPAAGPWATAAAARIGQSLSSHANSLLGASIPASARSRGERARGYCERLRAVAEPYGERATEVFRECLERSAEFPGLNRWTRICQRELEIRQPELFPPPARTPRASHPPPRRSSPVRTCRRRRARNYAVAPSRRYIVALAHRAMNSFHIRARSSASSSRSGSP